MKNLHHFTVLVIFFSISTPSISTFPHFFSNISSFRLSFLLNTTARGLKSFKQFSGSHFGQQVSGLSKLKNYLYHYGYIDFNVDSTSTFTDDFDYALQSAIKTYQLNFNLNVSGELDEQTLNQISKPRCGVADVINGSSTMNSSRPAYEHGSTVARYSFFPGKPRWSTRRRNLSYAFDPKNQISDEVKLVFTKAFDRWTKWTPLIFNEKSSYRTADIKIGFYFGNHGDGEKFDGVSGTLAHAFSPPPGLMHLDRGGV